MIKKCNKCNEYKTIENFTKNKNSKDSFDWICKSCRATINKDYYRRKAEKKKERFKEIEKSVIVEELEEKGLEHGEINEEKLKNLKFNMIDYPSDFLVFSMNNYDFCKKYNLNIDEFLCIRKKIYENKFKIN